MAQENLKLFGVNTFDYEDLRMKNPKIRFDDTCSYSNDDDNEERNESCLVSLKSSEVYLDPFSSNKTLDANELNKDNLELIEMNNDLIKKINALLREKHILQQETNELANRVKELELEVETIKVAKTKEVVESCLSCEKLTHEVDSLKSNVSNLQDEALSFSKFKKSRVNLDDMLCQQKLSQDKKDLGFSKTHKTTPTSQSKPIMFVKESVHVKSKSIIPQTHFSNTRGTQEPIANHETIKQFYKPVSSNGFGYTITRVDQRPLLPKPNLHKRPLFQKRKCSFNNRSSSHHQPYNSSQRSDNSYPNQKYFRPNIYQNIRPRFQHQSNFQNNHWSIFSRYGLETLSVLLQEPRMFNLVMLYTNHNGPNKHWGPSF
jgi:hypothetical protein